MEIYLVGGAVRDKLLNYPVVERDWVVVGATPEEMLTLNYKPVGKDFPVFLHPDTHDEYALARTERKTGHGYTGFSCHTDSNVTLEEDLRRRDLTINAIAEDIHGNLIDPYGGQNDIREKKIRHVSPAFSEDPLRILRVARFAARYHHLDFEVADETMDLMKTMVAGGEASYLVAERIWKELERALMERNPQVFLQVLNSCGALKVISPILNSLFDSSDKQHSNSNNKRAPLTALYESAKLQLPVTHRFAILCNKFPVSIADKKNTKQVIGDLCKKLRIPKTFQQLAVFVANHIQLVENLDNHDGEAIAAMLDQAGVLQNRSLLDNFLESCDAIFIDDHQIKQSRSFLLNARDQFISVRSEDFVNQGFSGKALGLAMKQERIHRINKLMQELS